MNQRLKEELQLDGAEALQQLFGMSERDSYTWVGLKSRWHHIQAERKAMTKALWFGVMRLFDWTCLRCGVRNYLNRESGKPKMEADHIVSLFHWGLSILTNMQVLCKPCNLWKSIQDIDYRANWQNGRFIKNV